MNTELKTHPSEDVNERLNNSKYKDFPPKFISAE